MESINLGAVLFGVLLVMWVAYALPRTASRRDEMGRARAADTAEMSSQARDLSAAVHSRRTSTEGNSSMSQDRLILRPADPTSRPRFEADPGIRIDQREERVRSRRVLRTVLAALMGASALLIALALTQVIAWWMPVLAVTGVGAFLVGLRRAELERRARTARAEALASQKRAQQQSARRRQAVADLDGAAEDVTDRASTPRSTMEDTSERAAQQLATPGEWTPRPVPRPSYALRGEVDDLATRHAAHRESMRSATVPLESDRVEELEAMDESFAPAQDLRLDEVLARRRA